MAPNYTICSHYILHCQAIAEIKKGEGKRGEKEQGREGGKERKEGRKKKEGRKERKKKEERRKRESKRKKEMPVSLKTADEAGNFILLNFDH